MAYRAPVGRQAIPQRCLAMRGQPSVDAIHSAPWRPGVILRASHRHCESPFLHVGTFAEPCGVEPSIRRPGSAGMVNILVHGIEPAISCTSHPVMLGTDCRSV